MFVMEGMDYLISMCYRISFTIHLMACKTCLICKKDEPESEAFSHYNITCFQCAGFFCSSCCDEIWTDEWTTEQFAKPKFFSGHQLFQCPLCLSAFDRFKFQ